jgi:hypothetical protein
MVNGLSSGEHVSPPLMNGHDVDHDSDIIHGKVKAEAKSNRKVRLMSVLLNVFVYVRLDRRP